MGSKLSLLESGLGKILLREAANADRFVDLFSGTGRVAWYVAEAVDVPVLAVDLQYYAVVLAGTVIERDHVIKESQVVDNWLLSATRVIESTAMEADMLMSVSTKAQVLEARRLCKRTPGGPIWTAYGGHYYSPLQALIFDVLLRDLPPSPRYLTQFCKALLIVAASRCAAAPGHTAQPFQPTKSAMPHIRTSWQRDPISIIRQLSPSLGRRHALRRGNAKVADANELAGALTEGDLVFLDPPYSSVHYSRFYHVLETIARGECGPVSGAGRYPPAAERPRSAYSIKSLAGTAMVQLLRRLSVNRCRVILTFPSGRASNGIEGHELAAYARRWYTVSQRVSLSEFSTLGGNGRNRSARRTVGEMVAVMHPL